jgi:hypothetical protein
MPSETYLLVPLAQPPLVRVPPPNNHLPSGGSGIAAHPWRGRLGWDEEPEGRSRLFKFE